MATEATMAGSAYLESGCVYVCIIGPSLPSAVKMGIASCVQCTLQRTLCTLTSEVTGYEDGAYRVVKLK